MGKKAIVFLEGNSRQVDLAIHELNKMLDKANSQPELTATMQTESVETQEKEIEFESAGETNV